MLNALRKRIQARRDRSTPGPTPAPTHQQLLWLWFAYSTFLLLLLLSFRLETQLFIYKTGVNPLSVGQWEGVAYDLGFIISWETLWLLLVLGPGRRAPGLWLNAFVLTHLSLQIVELCAEQFFRISHQRLHARFVLSLFSNMLEGTGRVAKSGIDQQFWIRGGTYFVLVLITERIARLQRPPALPSPRKLALTGLAVTALFVFLPLIPNAKHSPPGTNLLASFTRSLIPNRLRTSPVAPTPLTYEEPTIQSPHSPQAPNIVLILLESTRVDTIWPRDGAPPSMPFLNELSQKGVSFKRAMTSVTHTSSALEALHCGMFPELKARESEHVVPFHCLPALLNEAGYRTGYWQAASGHFESRVSLVTQLGYQSRTMPESIATMETPRTGYFGFDEQILVEPMVRWMKSDPTKPFLATALTVSTHHPYHTPGKPPPKEMNEGAYRVAAAHVDEVLRTLYSRMESEGLVDNTVFMFLGDHGEAFDTHIGFGAHDGVPYDDVTNVPLILFGPRFLGPPREDQELRHHVDLLPTLLNLSGARWTGQILGRDLLAAQGHEVVYSFCYWEEACAVQHRGHLATLYHYSLKFPEVFDSTNDPLQLEDLAPAFKPEQVEKSVNEIRSFERGVNELHANLKKRTSSSTAVSGAAEPRP